MDDMIRWGIQGIYIYIFSVYKHLYFFFELILLFDSTYSSITHTYSHNIKAGRALALSIRRRVFSLDASV